MKLKKNRRLTAGLCILALTATSLLSGFTYQDGLGAVHFESKMKIAPETYFTEQIGGHSTNGIEHAYFVTADTVKGNIKPYVFAGEITGKYTMDSMVSWVEKLGYKVVAGINGDLFDTASGAPKGLTITDGKVKSSGYAPESVIAFQKDGSAALTYVNVAYGMSATVPVYTTAPAVSGDPTAPQDPTAPPTTNVTYQTINAPIGFVNVPLGGANALHLFNRQYASSTKTKGSNVEVVLNASDSNNGEPVIGGTIKGTVVSVNTNTSNTPIGSTQIVLSTVAGSATAGIISQLTPGAEVTISAEDKGTGNLATATQAIGVYNVIAQGGVVTATSNSTAPRTCIGIKADGSLMMYVVDGRQTGVSGGLGLKDVAQHLVANGCVDVVNMDGGGSSMISVRSPGLDTVPKLKNSPSDKVQRKVANGLLLVYSDPGNKNLENISIYPANSLLMPGATVQLSAYGSDSAFEPVAISGGVSYSTSGDSKVDGTGLFTAGQTTGPVTVTGTSGSVSGTANIQIVEEVVFNTSVSTLSPKPGSVTDINVKDVKYGYVSVITGDNLFKWSCDPDVGTIDGNGVFTAAGKAGLTGNIYVEYKNTKKTIPVQVGGQTSLFSDTAGHWALSYIEALAKKNIVSGMGNNQFLPDSKLTRAQFLTMLSKTVDGLDVTKATPAGFTDVPATEWFYHYVNWGAGAGIVSGMDASTFAPNANITREQMAIMLVKYAASIGTTLPDKGSSISFTDNGLISTWAADSVSKIVKAGIMSGRPEGNFDPQGNATRAEATIVLYKMLELKAVSSAAQQSTDNGSDDGGASDATTEGAIDKN